MPARLDKERTIRPSAPDALIGGQLTMADAMTLPLTAGEARRFDGTEGELAVIAAVQRALTVTGHARYVFLTAGQAAAVTSDGPYIVQAVADCQCLAVHLKGAAAKALLAPYMDPAPWIFLGGAAAVRDAVMAVAVMEDEHVPYDGALAASAAFTMLVKLISLHAPRQKDMPELVGTAIAIIQDEFPC